MTIDDVNAETGPRIGGWLILPAIETWLEPLVYALPVLKVLLTFLDNRPLAVPLPIVITDSLLAALMCAGWVYAILLMLRHSRLFPRAFIALHIAQLFAVAIQLVEKWRAGLHAGHNAVFLGRAAAMAALWISYMYFSKRVKARFVN